jgi:hypothetical protein
VRWSSGELARDEVGVVRGEGEGVVETEESVARV